MTTSRLETWNTESLHCRGLLQILRMINNISDTEATEGARVGYGVPQPSLATKDIVIIVFMFLLWGYSLLLTYRAWYRILYSDGDEDSSMWRSLFI